MRERRGIFQHIDWWLVILFLVLVTLGWINIYAAVFDEKHSSILDMDTRYGKQLVWILASCLLAMIILLIDGKFFSQFAYLFYGIGILLLVAVIFSGREISGSKSWFQIAGIALQPAEFAKIGAALAVAKYLGYLDADIRKTRTLLTTAGILFLPIILIILQRDAGTALVFASLIFVVYRAGMSEKLMALLVAFPLFAVLALLMNKFILIALLFFAGVIYFLYTRRKIRTLLTLIVIYLASFAYIFSVDYGVNRFLEPHQRTRINVLIGNDIDLKGAGYNVNQSLIAIGSGGFWGKGFLQGTQTKYNFVPEQSTDFIFCTVGEEWGFRGSFLVIALFITLLFRIIFLAERQRSKFSRLYGYGVASIILFHFTINIGMTLGLVP